MPGSLSESGGGSKRRPAQVLRLDTLATGLEPVVRYRGIPGGPPRGFAVCIHAVGEVTRNRWVAGAVGVPALGAKIWLHRGQDGRVW